MRREQADIWDPSLRNNPKSPWFSLCSASISIILIHGSLFLWKVRGGSLAFRDSRLVRGQVDLPIRNRSVPPSPRQQRMCNGPQSVRQQRRLPEHAGELQLRLPAWILVGSQCSNLRRSVRNRARLFTDLTQEPTPTMEISAPAPSDRYRRVRRQP